MKKYIYWIMLFIFLISSVSAELIDRGTFTQNEQANFLFSCELADGGICTSDFNCNLTIAYPNSSLMVDNQQATRSGEKYNYTLPDSSTLGEYKNVRAFCTNGTDGGGTDYFFDITPNGYRQSTSQSIISFVLLITIAFGSIVFLILGWKFFDDERFWFFGVLSICLSLILLIYFFGTSITYARDLAYTSGSQNDQENVFSIILLVTRSMFLFVIPFVLWYGYSSWKTRKKERQANDGWDNDNY